VVTDALRAAGLPGQPVLEVAVRRLPRAYPVYRVGFEQHLAPLDAWATAQPRLVTFGRQGLFVHDNTHHALAMAWDAVDALGPADRFDDAAWTVARTRFATHVVED
jgi:protoporphyrinogen oxidase